MSTFSKSRPGLSTRQRIDLLLGVAALVLATVTVIGLALDWTIH